MMRLHASSDPKDVLRGQPPYGWKLTRDRTKLVRDPDEQRIIAMVRHMYFIRRLPMRAIVEELQELGVVNRRGKAFPLSRVCQLIHTSKNPPRAGNRARR